jgi:hypothetical protein
MSKAHRGKGIRDQFARGRGECPVCRRNNVKILYEQEAGEQKVKICKTCKAAVKHGKKSLPAAAPSRILLSSSASGFIIQEYLHNIGVNVNAITNLQPLRYSFFN